MMWWDMLGGISMLLFVVTFLISLVLFRVKVFSDADTIRISCRLRGSNNTDIPGKVAVC